MKKIFAVLVIATVFTACNNSTDKTTEATTDSLITESPLSDAVNTADSAGKVIEAGKDSMPKLIEKAREINTP